MAREAAGAMLRQVSSADASSPPPGAARVPTGQTKNCPGDSRTESPDSAPVSHLFI